MKTEVPTLVRSTRQSSNMGRRRPRRGPISLHATPEILAPHDSHRQDAAGIHHHLAMHRGHAENARRRHARRCFHRSDSGAKVKKIIDEPYSDHEDKRLPNLLEVAPYGFKEDNQLWFLRNYGPVSHAQRQGIQETWNGTQTLDSKLSGIKGYLILRGARLSPDGRTESIEYDEFRKYFKKLDQPTPGSCSGQTGNNRLLGFAEDQPARPGMFRVYDSDSIFVPASLALDPGSFTDDALYQHSTHLPL